MNQDKADFLKRFPSDTRPVSLQVLLKMNLHQERFSTYYARNLHGKRVNELLKINDTAVELMICRDRVLFGTIVKRRGQIDSFRLIRVNA